VSGVVVVGVSEAVGVVERVVEREGVGRVQVVVVEVCGLVEEVESAWVLVVDVEGREEGEVGWEEREDEVVGWVAWVVRVA
jgi:hypothetical protein